MKRSGTYPVGPAVALPGHGRQLGIQKVSGFVDALRKNKSTSLTAPSSMRIKLTINVMTVSRSVHDTVSHPP